MLQIFSLNVNCDDPDMLWEVLTTVQVQHLGLSELIFLHDCKTAMTDKIKNIFFIFVDFISLIMRNNYGQACQYPFNVPVKGVAKFT